MQTGGGQSPSADYFMSKVPANYDRALGVANQPFTPYTGALSPGVAPQIGSATAAAQGVANYRPLSVSAPTVAGTNVTAPMANAVKGEATKATPYQTGLGGINQYMNPYTSAVTDQTLAGLDRFRQMALNQGSSDAAMAGAWGGSRHGVADSLTNEAFARQAADTLAGLNLQGFNTSAGLLMGDRAGQAQNNQFNASLQQQMGLANMAAGNQAALANQQAGLTAGLANQQTGLTAGLANQQTNLAGQLANMQGGLDAAKLNLASAPVLGQLGGLQFAQQGAGVDAAYQEFLRQMSYPYQNQDLLNKTLGMVGSTYAWQPAGHPFANSFLGSSGQALALGQGLFGGAQGQGLSGYLWG